jgi:hypothetical protein
MNSQKLVWHHRCHGLLGVFDHLDQLLTTVRKAPYPRPDENKLMETLQVTDKFNYGVDLFTILKVPANSDIDKINL